MASSQQTLLSIHIIIIFSYCACTDATKCQPSCRQPDPLPYGRVDMSEAEGLPTVCAFGECRTGVTATFRCQEGKCLPQKMKRHGKMQVLVNYCVIICLTQ